MRTISPPAPWQRRGTATCHPDTRSGASLCEEPPRHCQPRLFLRSSSSPPSALLPLPLQPEEHSPGASLPTREAKDAHRQESQRQPNPRAEECAVLKGISLNSKSLSQNFRLQQCLSVSAPAGWDFRLSAAAAITLTTCRQLHHPGLAPLKHQFAHNKGGCHKLALELFTPRASAPHRRRWLSL